MAESLGIRGDPVGGESRIQGVLLLLEEPPPHVLACGRWCVAQLSCVSGIPAWTGWTDRGSAADVVGGTLRSRFPVL